ncbi:hypothetical protein TSAR_004449 [Trichomalopsis sarcophagae]|uniref:Uncharacterized protein n=1 Tax=Trichomalopsis sarcophagae TaxID=543379 RepID=A0A232EXF7_9HYME|nr:hypothetical protein TSAR_004449 [Trichomalopsis sarcophagae]
MAIFKHLHMTLEDLMILSRKETRTTIKNGRIKSPPKFSYANAPEPTGPISILKWTPGQARSRSVSPVPRHPSEMIQQGHYGHPYPPMMGPYPYMPPKPYCFYPLGNSGFPYPYMNPYMPYPMNRLCLA